MADNKNNVIGVRFDDSTLKRLKILAESTHDTISGIVRRATQYCLPIFEGAPVPVCKPAPEPPEQVAPEPVAGPDIFSVILKGNSNVKHTGNESEGEDQGLAQGARRMVDGD